MRNAPQSGAFTIGASVSRTCTTVHSWMAQSGLQSLRRQTLDVPARWSSTYHRYVRLRLASYDGHRRRPVHGAYHPANMLTVPRGRSVVMLRLPVHVNANTQRQIPSPRPRPPVRCWVLDRRTNRCQAVDESARASVTPGRRAERPDWPPPLPSPPSSTVPFSNQEHGHRRREGRRDADPGPQRAGPESGPGMLGDPGAPSCRTSSGLSRSSRPASPVTIRTGDATAVNAAECRGLATGPLGPDTHHALIPPHTPRLQSCFRTARSMALPDAESGGGWVFAESAAAAGICVALGRGPHER